MQTSKEKEAKSYLILLIDKNTLHLLTFLVVVLAVFSRYQQSIQSDRITVLDFNICILHL